MTGTARLIAISIAAYTSVALARYYDPSAPRFLPEPQIVPMCVEPASLNRFTYAQDNPLKFTDPTGNDVYVIYETGGVGHLGIAVDDPATPGHAVRADYGMVDYDGSLTSQARALLPSQPAFVNIHEVTTASLTARASGKAPTVVVFKEGKGLDTAVVKEINDSTTGKKVAHHAGKKTYSYPEAKSGYNAATSNCTDYCEDILTFATGGKYSNWTEMKPESVFNDIVKNKADIQKDITTFETSLTAPTKPTASPASKDEAKPAAKPAASATKGQPPPTLKAPVADQKKAPQRPPRELSQ